MARSKSVPDILGTLATCSAFLSHFAEKPDDPVIAPIHAEIVQTLQNIDAVSRWHCQHIDEIGDIIIREATEQTQG
jgi:hypothetical protein